METGVFLFTVLILTEQDMNASFVIVYLNANTTRTDTVSLSSLGIAVCDHKNSSERSVNLRLAKWGVGGGGRKTEFGGTVYIALKVSIGYEIKT